MASQPKSTAHIARKLTPKLRKASQPPLSYAGAIPDSDRARKPPLGEHRASNEELEPGDRVEGLGNFGKPSGEFGTVERTNEEDAEVKWDDDGRVRVHQPSLKKVQAPTFVG
jgi:preprotein translocase subunit YajC